MNRNILHLTPSISPLSGGLGTVTVALASEQRRRDWNARIWCADDAATAAESARRAGLDGAVDAVRARGPRALAFSPDAERRARTELFDVVHQHGIWTAQARVTAAMRRRKVPTVVAPHGSLEPYAVRRSAWKKKIALALFERENLREASCLHATAESEVATLRDLGLRAPVAIIPNGVDESWLQTAADGERFRASHGIAPHERILLFVSRIDPKKGLPMLVAALARLGHRLDGWRVVIAGQDEKQHRAEVEALAAREQVAIQFVGPIFGDEKRDMFAAADVFILPTHSDNFGIVIAEALGAGVPVITTHGAPWRELETHSCGWWVPIDVEHIAAAIDEARGTERERLRSMGERGRRLIRGRYTWPVVVERTLALYRWLTREAERPDFVVVD